MYASGLARWSRGTVWVVHVLLPRHSPMLRALLCALYTLSLSRSLAPLSLSLSPFPLFPSIRHSASSSQFLQISSLEPPLSLIELSPSLYKRVKRACPPSFLLCNIGSIGVGRGARNRGGREIISIHFARLKVIEIFSNRIN